MGTISREKLDQIKKGKKIVEDKCLVFAQTNTRERGYFKSIRVYKKQSDKGKPTKAIYYSDKMNKRVLNDLKKLPVNCKELKGCQRNRSK